MTPTPSTEERVWAVFAHISALALGMGILLPVLGWSSQRGKSRYVAFQSLQALGYQSLGYTIWILFALVIVVIQLFNTFAELLAATEAGADFARLLSISMSGHFVVMLGLIGLYLALPLLAVFACALGRDFRYPLLGMRLANYLNYPNDPNEDNADRFVAAMGHFSVIILLWGMLAPLTAWIMEGRRSRLLRFQSMQTLVYQAVVTGLFFLAVFLYVFGGVALVGLLAGSMEGGLDETVMFGLALLGCLMLVVVVVILLVPFLHILGQMAGYRVLKGVDYHYPLVGRLVERWMQKD